MNFLEGLLLKKIFVMFVLKKVVGILFMAFLLHLQTEWQAQDQGPAQAQAHAQTWRVRRTHAAHACCHARAAARRGARDVYVCV